MTYLGNNIRIGSIFLFCILAVVIINPSIAQESPVTLNSSHDPAILRNISHIDSPVGTVTHRYLFSRDDIPGNVKKSRFDIKSLKHEHKPGELLVRYTNKLSTNDFRNYYKSQNITLIKDYPKIGYHLIQVDESKLENTIKALSISDKFENAEPNYIVEALKKPANPNFDQLWGMDNTGQTGGTYDADIDAPEAWNISTGSRRVIVAVIDTGVDYTHEDLAENMWTNSGEIPDNGIDDDHNGFVDDYYGWDFAYDDNNPMDVYFHGTHVSGTIGGAGNNGKGVAGVSWDVSIMAVKFIGDDGWGYTSDAIEAINYATMMGADVMSNSWGGGEYSSALEAAIRAADEAGILFVAAAGNYAENTDDFPAYPAGYDVPNVLSVAATDHNDSIAYFSNFGNLTVDLGAPGVDILSSVPGNGYSSYSGTSMAVPHVSGAAALLKAFNPTLTHYEIKNILMNSVDSLPSLNGKTVTGGRLNIHKAINIASRQVNLIKNPGFESGTSSWLFFPNGTEKFSVVSPGYEGTKAARLALDKNGTNIQLYQTNVILEPKGIYRLSFAANSTTGHDVMMRLYQHFSPYTDYGLTRTFNLGTNWETFTTEFTATNIVNAVNDGRLVFWLAPFAESGDIYYIDDVELVKIGVDNNPPMVIRNTPIEGNSPVTTQINVTFSEAMNKTSAQSAFSTSPAITGNFSWNGNTMLYTPRSNLTYEAKFTVTIGTGAKDLAGNSLQSSFRWQFGTGRVHNINKGTNYTTIQAAIDDASPGNEIHVDSGTYYENLNISKQLILRGENNLTAIIDGNGSGNVVEVKVNGVVIKGLRIQNGSNGIYVNSSDNVISNNMIMNMHGVKGADDLTDYGVGGGGGPSSGIYMSGYMNNTISGNIFSNISGGMGGAGEYAGSGGPSSGIYLSATTKNNIMDNMINNIEGGNGGKGADGGSGGSGGTATGVYLSDSNNNNVKTNSISNARGGAGGTPESLDGLSSGIYVSNSTNNILSRNIASNNNYSLSLDSSSHNSIYDNIFTNNGDVQFYGSNVDTWNITRQSGTNIIGGRNLGGNFWANPSGTGFSQTCKDIDYDGICESPYVLDANNTDHLPLAYKPLPKNITSCTIISSPGEFTLNKSILNNAASNCIKITSSNVILDGAGHTIDGINAQGTSGVYIYNSSKIITNATVKNLKVTDWSNGIYYKNSNGGIIINNSVNSNSIGIILNFSNFNNVTGNNISNSTNIGIEVYENSNNNTINGNKVNNSRSGIFFLYSFNTTASNNKMENNSFNFGVGGSLQSHFDGNNIDKTNLANGRPIYYIKYGKNTIYDSSIKASTFYCILCNNVTVKDLEMSNMDRGVYFWSTSNSRIQNITVKESGWGIFLRNSTNNTIQNSTFSTNNKYDYSEKGVSIYSSDDNTFVNNTIISNNYGIEFSSSNKNTIYNNYFNNTNNLFFRGMNNNIWNITKKSGTNIIGGSYLGGNFWVNSSGNGFSQTCSDSNIDGLCDLRYSLNNNNSDYLPLKYKSVIGITVSSPNGGENWNRGTTRKINWTPSGSPGTYVRIELLKPGKKNQLIISSTPNDGSHPWLIPAAQAQGSDYKVRITSTANAAYNDTSDDNFTIPIPSFTVVSPNGGEDWTRGTTRTIKWNSTENPKDYVKIELLKSGVLSRTIVSRTLNDGSQTWTIPATQASGADYKIRINSTSNPAYTNSSKSNFSISI